MTIKIRLANKDDFDILLSFKLKLLKHTSQIDPETEYNIQKATINLKNNLNKENNIFFVAYHNEEPVGYLHVDFDDNKNKTVSYLSDLYILDEYRGRGIGGKLVLNQLNYLKKIGMTENTLTTTKSNNEKTINFYNKLGYELTQEHNKKNIVYLLKRI